MRRCDADGVGRCGALLHCRVVLRSYSAGLDHGGGINLPMWLSCGCVALRVKVLDTVPVVAGIHITDDLLGAYFGLKLDALSA